MKKNIFIFSILFISFFLFLDNLFAQNQAPAEWATCGACHSIGKGKIVGPDLKGVTERREEAWLISFIKSSQTMVREGDPIAVQVFEEHNKIPMPDNPFTDEQIKGILAYIVNYDEVTEAAAQAETVTEATDEHAEVDQAISKHEEKYDTGTTQPTFIIFLILLFVAIIDLVFTKIIRAKFIHIIIILVAIFVVGEIVYVEAKALGRQQGYSPDQPIWFSHQVHSGQNKIDCLYCHSTSDESKSAGIPGTAVCMNCHNVVKNGTITGTEEIAKILESYESGKPIEWVRVHNLPDHVWFSHAQHVNAGKRECEECHGLVEEMDRLAQVEDLSMGWCISCHRRTEVQFEANEFYEEYIRFHEEIKSGKRTRVTVDDIGGNNCQICHY